MDKHVDHVIVVDELARQVYTYVLSPAPPHRMSFQACDFFEADETDIEYDISSCCLLRYIVSFAERELSLCFEQTDDFKKTGRRGLHRRRSRGQGGRAGREGAKFQKIKKFGQPGESEKLGEIWHV